MLQTANAFTDFSNTVSGWQVLPPIMVNKSVTLSPSCGYKHREYHPIS